MYAYKITNKNNNRIYWGRTKRSTFEEDFKTLLEQGKHYNLLLQKDYEPDIYEWSDIQEFDEGQEKELSEYVIDKIREDNSHRAFTGYNLYSDQHGKSRTADFSFFDEDIVVPYALGNKTNLEIKKETGASRNIFDYRLKRNGLDPENKISLSNYDIVYAFAERVIALESPKALKADMIIDRMMNRYQISSKLRVTPPRLAKKLRGFGIPMMKKDNYGYFYVPNEGAYIPEVNGKRKRRKRKTKE